jgi:hypothetical protein
MVKKHPRKKHICRHSRDLISIRRELGRHSKILQGQSERETPKTVEKALEKYNLGIWADIDYNNALTGIAYRLEIYMKEIRGKYDRPFIGKVIGYARKEGLHPRAYAAFVGAALDDTGRKSAIDGLDFKPDELEAFHAH